MTYIALFDEIPGTGELLGYPSPEYFDRLHNHVKRLDFGRWAISDPTKKIHKATSIETGLQEDVTADNPYFFTLNPNSDNLPLLTTENIKGTDYSLVTIEKAFFDKRIAISTRVEIVKADLMEKVFNNLIRDDVPIANFTNQLLIDLFGTEYVRKIDNSGISTNSVTHIISNIAGVTNIRITLHKQFEEKQLIEKWDKIPFDTFDILQRTEAITEILLLLKTIGNTSETSTAKFSLEKGLAILQAFAHDLSVDIITPPSEVTGGIDVDASLIIDSFDLIMNASKVESENGNKNRIAIVAQRDEKSLNLSFLNTGIPLSTSWNERFPGRNINEIFKKGATSKKRHFKSITIISDNFPHINIKPKVQRKGGSGLYHWKNSVERMGGNVGVMSPVDSEFLNDVREQLGEGEVNYTTRIFANIPIKMIEEDEQIQQAFYVDP